MLRKVLLERYIGRTLRKLERYPIGKSDRSRSQPVRSAPVQCGERGHRERLCDTGEEPLTTTLRWGGVNGFPQS